MEREPNLNKKDKKDTEKNQPEKEFKQHTKYEDLIRLYYLEALSKIRPTIEREYENTVLDVLKKMIKDLEKHPYILNPGYTDEEMWGGAKKEAALQGAYNYAYSRLLGQLQDVEKGKFNIDGIMWDINEFIWRVHERMKITFGSDFLGISEEELDALNFIDIEQPLSEQKEIMFKKLEEYYREKENNKDN